jgi:hypothetical protein
MTYYATGEVYTGDFSLNTWHGYGELVSRNGDTYKGQFYQGQKHGQGESYEAAKQKYYKGQFASGRQEGWGRITAPALAGAPGQRVYEGFLKNDLRHGQGTLWFNDAYGQLTTFSGNWANGVLNGQGRQQHPSQHLIGTFVNGSLEGNGTETDPMTGKTHAVLFQHGLVVQRYGCVF